MTGTGGCLRKGNQQSQTGASRCSSNRHTHGLEIAVTAAPSVKFAFLITTDFRHLHATFSIRRLSLCLGAAVAIPYFGFSRRLLRLEGGRSPARAGPAIRIGGQAATKANARSPAGSQRYKLFVIVGFASTNPTPLANEPDSPRRASRPRHQDWRADRYEIQC